MDLFLIRKGPKVHNNPNYSEVLVPAEVTLDILNNICLSSQEAEQGLVGCRIPEIPLYLSGDQAQQMLIRAQCCKDKIHQKSGVLKQCQRLCPSPPGTQPWNWSWLSLELPELVLVGTNQNEVGPPESHRGRVPRR